MNGDPELLFHIFKVKYLKIIYWKYKEFLLVSFPWKNFLGNICKKIGFWGNYPLIFTLSGGQSYDSKNYFQKFRLYMPQIFGVAKKSETF